MAVSLLRRGLLLRHSCSLCYSHFNSRLFSSSKDENDQDNTPNKDLAENQNLRQQTTSESSLKDGLLATTSSSRSEGAVEKFFKVVRKVEEAQTKTRKSDLVESQAVEDKQDSNESFATMLRKCKLVSLGDISNRVVEGTIIEVMDDDLYIDFGGKFHCICPRPKWNPGQYHRGTRVLVNLQATEMSSAFLGSDIHVTLLEADGTLLGLADFRGQRASTPRK